MGTPGATLIAIQQERIAELEAAKNGAYRERDALVCALSKLFPSALEKHPDSDTEWEDDWRWIVFVDLPTGQATWHIHDSELPMFDHLSRETGTVWDGHTTEEKYARLEALQTCTDPSVIEPLPETPERAARTAAVREVIKNPKRIAELEAEVSDLTASQSETSAQLEAAEAEVEEALRERDAANDALSKAHIALGGDGEWVAKPGSTCPAGDTGDLAVDVPAIAAALEAEVTDLRGPARHARETAGALGLGDSTNLLLGTVRILLEDRDALFREVGTLRADRDRYREALEKIRDYGPPSRAWQLKELAKEALAAFAEGKD